VTLTSAIETQSNSRPVADPHRPPSLHPPPFRTALPTNRQDALAAVRYLNGTSLDERAIRADIDYGFEEGRQFGRGRSGGQVRGADFLGGGVGRWLVAEGCWWGLVLWALFFAC